MASIARNILLALGIYVGILGVVYGTYHILGVVLPVGELNHRLKPSGRRLLESPTGELWLWCPNLSDWVDVSGACGGAGCDVEPPPEGEVPE